MNPSLSSKIFARILKLTRLKKVVERRVDKKIRRSKKAFLPGNIKKKYKAQVFSYKDKTIASFEHKQQVSKQHILFLHGGGYVFEAVPAHWSFAQKIVKQSFCRMSLIDYPLAPEHNYKDSFDMLQGAYELLLTKFPDDEFILMGDSAGAGLALAFAQQLIAKGHPKLPVKTILLSPWLDISMSNPDIKALEPKDHLLSVEMLRKAALLYSDGEDLQNPLLSPINGSFKDIPESLIFYGTEELFHADCCKLKALSEEHKHPFIFKEYAGMQHDWALFPIPEGKRVIEEICSFLLDK